MTEHLIFKSREEFRNWLSDNYHLTDGFWLLFDKSKAQKTIKANDALEEALCFGWIDGQMKRVDDESYIKYFAARRKNSKWSKKNKEIVRDLEERGLMADHGRLKIEEAKQNGQWDAPESAAITDEQMSMLSDLLKEHEPAFTNFCGMSPSVRKTYARGYFEAKTDAGREKRLTWMIDRLNKNLRPM